MTSPFGEGATPIFTADCAAGAVRTDAKRTLPASKAVAITLDLMPNPPAKLQHSRTGFRARYLESTAAATVLGEFVSAKQVGDVTSSYATHQKSVNMQA